MKFIHTGDLHLGASPDLGYSWGEERKSEIWESFQRLIQKAYSEKYDLMLISGDIFHRKASPREVKELSYLLSCIPQTQVAMIAGNHDWIGDGDAVLSMEWPDNVAALWNKDLTRSYSENCDAWIYGFSYHSQEIGEARYAGIYPGRESGYHILLAHGGDETHIPINLGKLERAGFDYVALGHIHKPWLSKSGRIGYCGALEPLDRNDVGGHGYICGELQGDRVITEFVPFATRSYLHRKIKVDERTTQFSLEKEIREEINRLGKQNLYVFQLEGCHGMGESYDEKRLKNLGNILEIKDASYLDYDVEALQREYEGNLLGDFIDKFKNSNNELEKKALHYGVEALLTTRR